MLEGIAKKLEQYVDTTLSFYVKDCPDLNRVAIRVVTVTNDVVEGFIQTRVRVGREHETCPDEVEGTDEHGWKRRYPVAKNVTANGRRVFIREENIVGWSPAQPYDAVTERMPYRDDVFEKALYRYD